uniref:Cell cycle checkpoint protein RAD1 n=1 Tax=Caenorhabditis tropicalis TaxID=1561998 RepID=A0A1I7SZ68_9PELO
MELDMSQRTIMEMKKENVKEFAQILKTVVFKDFGMLYAFSTGIKITVDDGAFQQANAFLNSAFFSDFKVRENNIALKLPIKTIYEFLSIPDGHSNSVKISYSGTFDPLKLLIEEADGCIIRGKFNSSVSDQELDFEFDDRAVPVTYLLKTQVLKDIFRDFDDTSRIVKVQLSKSSLCFSTFGEVGEITVSIPSKSLQMESVKCSEEVEYTYLLSLMHRMNAAFALASKLILRVDDRGVLSCQFSIEHGEGRSSYIEFLTVPTDDSDE